jgi:hypothetical protein
LGANLPKRLVDGDALWRSQKLKNVKVEYRAEYANLIPLAEANGVFEADPTRVWSDVYSFNRPDVDVKSVIRILNEFEKAGMLHRWEEKGKIWGYFNGIENRLPPPSSIARGDYRIVTPNPPHVEPKGTPCEPQERFGLGKVRYGKAGSKAQYPETKISEIWEQRSGRTTEPKNQFKKELKELIRVYGEDEVLSQFEIWATLNNGNYYKRPISAFIKQYTGTATVNGNLFNMSEINDLAVELSFLSGGDITFNRLNLNGLALLLRDFSKDELITAFKKFYSENEQDPQWAAKDFVEKAPQLILVARMQKERDLEQKRQIEQIKVQVQSEVASGMANSEAQAAQDETLLEDTIQTFNLDLESGKSLPSEQVDEQVRRMAE